MLLGPDAWRRISWLLGRTGTFGIEVAMDSSTTRFAGSTSKQDASKGLGGQPPGWSGLEIELCHIRAGVTRVPATPYHRLGIHFGPPVNAYCQCDGRHHRRVQSHGDIDVVPAGLEGAWEDDADCSILRLRVSPALVRQAARDLDLDPERVEIKPQFQLRDQRIEHIAWALNTELRMDLGSDRLYAESLGLALAVRLVQGAVPRTIAAAGQTLSSRQRRRLVDFVEAHLDRNLSLADLARVAAIGVSHLKVLFRRSFGMTVHQYVIHRRVERAMVLLSQGKMPANQVALEAGFAHQSHMAQCMKRVLGITPGAIARTLR
jgi:AraC family transcriptional regulator